MSKLSFISFCIEHYAQHTHKSSDEVYELFMDLEASDSQLDFPILYGIARQGIVVRDPEEVKDISIEKGGSKIRKGITRFSNARNAFDKAADESARKSEMIYGKSGSSRRRREDRDDDK